MPDFTYYPKTPRLSSGYIITEKLDGSQAAVVIEELGGIRMSSEPSPHMLAQVDGEFSDLDVSDEPMQKYRVYAQSRNRFITPQSDNFGFAAWVQENAEELVEILGPGRHFGEWWGHGIQRGYGLPRGERHFSLFNVTRHNPLGSMADLEAYFAAPPAGREPLFPDLPELSTVPVISAADNDRSLRAMSHMVDRALAKLSLAGSFAAEFARPEGIVLFHSRSNQVFKAFLPEDEKAPAPGASRQALVLAA